MKNKIMLTSAASLMIVIVLMLITTLLTGCTSGVSAEKYKVGTDGLVLEFSKSTPTSVYEREEFGTAIFIKNIGSYDISKSNPAKLKVLFDNYRLSSKQGTTGIEISDIALNGKSKYYPAGAETPVEVYFESNSLTQLRESAKTTINYNLCYPYTTEFTTMTCIDTKATNKADAAVACTSEVYNGGAVQGAPIVVTKIEPEIMLQENYIRPQYKIYIENRGGGYVTSKNTCDSADFSIVGDARNDFSGKVKVYATLAGETLDCGADQMGILRLVDGESFIRCYLSRANQNTYSRTTRNYLTTLTVKVEYTYVVLAKQEIEIKRNDMIEPDVTQGLCNSYQVEYDGKCVNKCDYCASNPSDFMCQEGKPYPGFVFREGFSCTCSLQQCNLKEGKGSCIKGYCPGNQYCCSTLDCSQWEVEYNGQCIDKCTYCSEHNDTQTCGTFDFTGFQCEYMKKEKCDTLAQDGACILGYCGADIANGGKPGDEQLRYCANLQIAANIERTVEIYNKTGKNVCEYCASINGAEEVCKFTNNRVGGRINSDFGCYCVSSDVNRYPSYAIDPKQLDCFGKTSGVYNYCCNTQADPGYALR